VNVIKEDPIFILDYIVELNDLLFFEKQSSVAITSMTKLTGQLIDKLGEQVVE